MSQNFIYKRKFIILKDEMTTIAGVKPRGHGKIEVRGNKGYISLNVENGEGNEEYRSYLIGEKNGDIREVYLGRIFTNERGKGQINTNFNINNVKNTRLSLREFNGLLISRNSNILLSAYIDKNDGLLSRYIMKLQEKRKETVQEVPKTETKDRDLEEIEVQKAESKEIEEIQAEAKEELIVEEVKERERAEETEIQKTELEEIEEIQSEAKEELIVEEVEEREKTEEIEVQKTEPEEIKEIQAEVKEELIVEEIEEIEKVKEIKAETEVEEFEIGDIIEEIKEDMKEREVDRIIEEKINTAGTTAKKNYEDLEYIKKQNYKNKLNNYVLSILKFFPYVKPFVIQLEGYDWWRIEYDNEHSYRGFLPFSNYLNNISYNYVFMRNTVSPMSLMEKYNHYLFGMYKECNDVIYYVYGVPGHFISTEHPYRGVSGFNTWFEGKEGHGYWLLYIEPITGKILFPLSPMTPLK